jgi:hypothetical protein
MVLPCFLPPFSEKALTVRREIIEHAYHSFQSCGFAAGAKIIATLKVTPAQIYVS